MSISLVMFSRLSVKDLSLVLDEWNKAFAAYYEEYEVSEDEVFQISLDAHSKKYAFEHAKGECLQRLTGSKSAVEIDRAHSDSDYCASAVRFFAKNAECDVVWWGGDVFSIEDTLNMLTNVPGLVEFKARGLDFLKEIEGDEFEEPSTDPDDVRLAMRLITGLKRARANPEVYPIKTQLEALSPLSQNYLANLLKQGALSERESAKILNVELQKLQKALLEFEPLLKILKV